MGTWAEVPEDLLVLTAKQVTLFFKDFVSFSGICRSRHSVAINDNFEGSEHIPWLMLSDKDKPDERQFISPRKDGVIRTVNLPEARGKRCLESLGWLVTLAEDGEMNLLHPFNDYHFRSLYKHPSFIHKAVLSSRPEESKDYVLVVLHGNVGHLGFWRPGDKSWTDVEVPILGFCDIIFHEGLLYGVMGHGMVLAFDVLGPNPTRPWFGLGIPDICFGFRVFKAASSTNEWVEIMRLGDNALFLGENASISVDASRFLEIKANCIYYTDNFWNFYQRGGVNTGIYSLEDGSKSPCYEEEYSFNPICPPLRPHSRGLLHASKTYDPTLGFSVALGSGSVMGSDSAGLRSPLCPVVLDLVFDRGFCGGGGLLVGGDGCWRCAAAVVFQ
ncbi:uncharacterized protein At1g65760-like [Rhododendron vialii]|uniref:uncharacterized protein At1g65760-like n=1 Tax=Rhododendron vialii TaxID=182163 RepID=UPI00265F3EF1|nr:uncharacterized protein At1g65760-like [Rhododendron vialii]